MNKKQKQVSYELAKVSYGIYLVEQLRQQCGKDFPTETDVKKLLLKINASYTASELQPAKQISRYCQTARDYLRDAREETLDKAVKLLQLPIKSFYVFREKISPAMKSFKYYATYIEQAEQYLKSVQSNPNNNSKQQFCTLFSCNDQTKVYLSMISYHFGETNKDLPAISFGAESDVKTERVIRDLFDSFDLPSPQYIPGNIFMEQIATQNDPATFIAIGLFGNALTEWIYAHGYLLPGLGIIPLEKRISLLGKSYFTSREEGLDYAIFCKAALPNGSHVFIIGGIEGFGTQKMGEYLSKDWPQLQEQTIAQDNIVLLFRTTEKETKLLVTAT